MQNLLSSSGLVVDAMYPIFGASPDGIINCTCCGCGVLEVKCPYRCKDKSFLEASKESTFFLVSKSESMALDTSHAYYYQVQAQIKLCGANFDDFIGWSEKELFIERIYLDNEFISDAMDKQQHFSRWQFCLSWWESGTQKYQYRAHLMLSHTLLIPKKQRSCGASADKRSQVK